MNNHNETTGDTSNTLNELNTFLSQKKEEYKMTRKAAWWDEADCNRFFSSQISPTFKDIIKNFKLLNHLDVKYKKYHKVCRITVRSKLDVFIFKVIVDNRSRYVVFLCEINYKHKHRNRFIKIKNTDTEQVSFHLVDTINNEFVISLFTKWYKAKDDIIAKAKGE